MDVEEWINKNRKWIRGIVFNLAKNFSYNDIKEIEQICLIKIWKRIDLNRNPETFVKKLIRRTIIDQWRNRKKLNYRNTKLNYYIQDKIFENIISYVESKDRVNWFVNQLPVLEGKICLSLSEGVTKMDTAKELGLTVSNLRTIICRRKDKWKEIWDSYEEED